MCRFVKPTAGLMSFHPAALIAASGTPCRRPTSLASPAGRQRVDRQAVVQRYSEFALKIDNQVVDPNRITFYSVEQVDGPDVRLQAPQLNGWAPADQVVPVEQAIEFFTESIRLKPGDSFAYTMRGIIWLQEKQEFDKALADFDEAIRLEPADGSAFSAAAALVLEEGIRQGHRRL